MTGYKFKVTNSRGEFFYINDFVTDPLRFFALQDYPDFDVDIKNAELAKEGQHGVFDFFSFYGKRVINFNGVIVGETEADVETLKMQMLKVISLPPIPVENDDGYLTISWTDANGDDWQIDGKLQGYPRFNRGLRQGSRLYFIVTFKCKNPEIESQEEISTNGLRGWQQGSLLLPALLPGVFDVIYDKEFIVSNAGSIAAHTKIKVSGEPGITVSNPYILNRTTGTIFKVNITLADETEWITIDSKTGTVIDQDGTDRSGLVDGVSEYILLTLGDNHIVFLSDESFGSSSPVNTWIEPTAAVTIKHRTTVI